LDDQAPPAKRYRRTAKEVHPSEYLDSKKEVAHLSDQQVVSWLEEQASSQPGYDAFLDSRGRTVQNPEVVELWKFVATFANTHAGKSSGVPVCGACVVDMLISDYDNRDSMVCRG
jgi:hypothetical protein